MICIMIIYNKCLRIQIHNQQVINYIYAFILAVLIIFQNRNQGRMSTSSKKRKQKVNNEKQNNQQVKEGKRFITQGKVLYQKAICNEQIDEALEHFTKAINKSAMSQVLHLNHIYHYRGLCYFRLNKFEEAERDFHEAISISDQKSKVHFYNSLGKCKIEMSSYLKDSNYLDEGIKCFEKSIEHSGKQDAEAYFNLAIIYHKQLQNHKAIQNFTKSIELKTSNLYQAYIERGTCYREIADYQKSTDDFFKACEIKKEVPVGYFNLGINLLLKQKYQDALHNFEKAIQINRIQPQYYNYKGLALYLSGQYEQCLSILNQALKIYQNRDIKNSEVGECYYNAGNALLNISKNAEALKMFQKADEKQYLVDQELKLKIYYCQGRGHENLKNNEIAVEKFLQCLNLIGVKKDHDLYLSVYYHLGLNQLICKNYKQSINCLSNILQYDTTVSQVFELRGRAYMESNQFESALKDFQRVSLQRQNYAEAYFLKGVSKVNLGQVESAIQDFFRAIEVGSVSPRILNGLSQAYYLNRKYEKSLIYSNLSLEKQPNNQQFLIQRSRIYLELGQKSKGIQDLTKALQVNKTNSVAYYRRGLAYYKNRQNQSAILDLLKALQYSPSSNIEPDIHYHLGIAYEYLQQYQQAILPFTNAINLDRKAKYYHERAKCYLIINENINALNDLNEVLLLQPTNAFGYFRRGFAHKALKMYDEAAEDFCKAREIAPDDPNLIINKKQIYHIKYRKLCEPGQQQ